MITINKHSDIPGWGDFDNIFIELVADLPQHATILEIGVGFGRGTWALLNSMRDTMALHVMDTFDAECRSMWANTCDTGSKLTLSESDTAHFIETADIYSHKDLFQIHMAQHVRHNQIEATYTMTSEHYIDSDCGGFFDLVFLDGDHSYENVKRELEYFKDSKILAGHDYGNPDCPSVKAAVDEFMLNNSDRVLKIYDENEVFVIRPNS